MKFLNHLLIPILLFFLIQNDALAQNEIDSLIQLSKNKSGNDKVNILNQLSISYRFKSLNTSFEYANQAIRLAKKNDYTFGEGEGYKNRGVVFYMQHKYPEALIEYQKAYELFSKIEDHSKISAILNNRAIIWVIQGEYENALKDYEKAVEINLKLENYSSVANIYNNMGLVYNNRGNTEKTMDYYTKSLNISIRENNKIGMAASYNNIAVLEKSRGNYDKAIDYYQKALKINEDIGDKGGTARCLSNMASVYSEIKQNEKAMSLNKEALEIEKELNNEQGVLKAYSKIGQLQIKLDENEEAIISFENLLNIAKSTDSKDEMIEAYKFLGIAYKNLKNYEKALKNYQLSINIAEGLENKRDLSILNFLVGKCYFEMNNKSKALQYYNKSLVLAENHDMVSLLEDLYKSMSNLYSEFEDFKNALKYQSKYIEIHEKIYNEENQKRLVELQTQFETEKKEREILQLKSDKQKAKQNLMLVVIISIFLAFIVVLGFLYNRNLIKKKSIKLLDLKNSELEKANKELIIAKEKAEESDQLKTAFLANISHEIRTPMNAIIGFSDFLLDPNVDPKEKEELNRLINFNSERLLNLIDDIIDVAKIESGQLRIKNEKVSLNHLIQEVYTLMKENRTLKDSQIKFKHFYPQNNDVILNTDSFRLKQILTNLIDNAIKFTKNGEVEFGYEQLNSKEESKVLFTVKDTGIGIDKKYHNSIFDMFYKVPTDNSILFRGTGIGLSIVKNLLEQMDGNIWIQSTINEGSTFFFTLPIQNTLN